MFDISIDEYTVLTKNALQLDYINIYISYDIDFFIFLLFLLPQWKM